MGDMLCEIFGGAPLLPLKLDFRCFFMHAVLYFVSYANWALVVSDIHIARGGGRTLGHALALVGCPAPGFFKAWACGMVMACSTLCPIVGPFGV